MKRAIRSFRKHHGSNSQLVIEVDPGGFAYATPTEPKYRLMSPPRNPGIDLEDFLGTERFGTFALTMHGPLGSDLRTEFTTAPGSCPWKGRIASGFRATGDRRSRSYRMLPSTAPRPASWLPLTLETTQLTRSLAANQRAEARSASELTSIARFGPSHTRPSRPYRRMLTRSASGAKNLRTRSKMYFYFRLAEVVFRSVSSSMRHGLGAKESRTYATVGAEGRWKFDLAPL